MLCPSYYRCLAHERTARYSTHLHSWRTVLRFFVSAFLPFQVHLHCGVWQFRYSPIIFTLINQDLVGLFRKTPYFTFSRALSLEVSIRRLMDGCIQQSALKSEQSLFLILGTLSHRFCRSGLTHVFN
jgi:hypothetical protein